MGTTHKHEGLSLARLIMVLGSISPLFILWAIRGTCQSQNTQCQTLNATGQIPKEICLVPNFYFVAVCCAFIVLPNAFLLLRRWMAHKQKDAREVIIGKAEDHRDHLLVYLFAMLLPFYASNLTNWREFSATVVAVCFIVFLFSSCNLHYMNLLFAIMDYRIFTVYPPDDGNPRSGRESVVLITRRATICSGERIHTYRLSNTVYWED